MNNDIDTMLEEASLKDDGNFKANLFLSTDGKMTVSVEAETQEGRKAMWVWAKKVYQYLLENYGTKQEANVKAYRENLGDCEEHKVPFTDISKKGKKYHKSEIGEYCFGRGFVVFSK